MFRKIFVMSSNFVKKYNWRDKLSQKSKKVVKVQVSTIRLNRKRSNTYKQSIEDKIVTQDILVNCLYRMINTL